MKITINPTLDMETLQFVSNDGVYDYDGPVIKFDRSQQKAGKGAQQQENTVAGQEGINAAQINSTLIPGLEKEATNPSGYNPTDINNMLVASQEGAGGANSSIVGQGGLQATRTRNTGNIGSVLDEAARQKGRTLSSNALGIQNENANLKQEQQKFAQEQLGGASKEDTQAMLSAMGMVPQSIDATTKAGQSGWFQNMTGFMSALGQDAAGAGKLIHG